MQCLVCGSETFSFFHKGTRDNCDIDVMQCESCKSFQLSSFSQIHDGYYEEGNMHESQYNVEQAELVEEAWRKWIEDTKEDDWRRRKMYRKICERERTKILDFGCGNGGFLRAVKQEKNQDDVYGVELDKEARVRLNNENIKVYKRLNEIKQTVRFDVITMFHVIEHLDNPQKILAEIKEHLKDDGLLIIETPNADDALISKYRCKSFMDFTFWSAHLFLYNSYSLELLMNQCGFTAVENGQLQRYPLANHLYWLAEGKPGGHVKWKELNQDTANSAYEDMLRSMGKCDTLFGVFRKTAGDT